MMQAWHDLIIIRPCPFSASIQRSIRTILEQHNVCSTDALAP